MFSQQILTLTLVCAENFQVTIALALSLCSVMILVKIFSDR